LNWTEPESELIVEGYSIYRNYELRITNDELGNKITFLDEDLAVGQYEYYVVTHYTNGCISDSSNHVVETIGVGINEMDIENRIVLYPNPTAGELRITNYELGITSVEVFDIYGSKLTTYDLRLATQINISHLQAGIYFVKIYTQEGTITKKIIKY
jgi:hypothetical protein